jgi:hypothetical protein
MGAPWTPPIQQGFDNDNSMRLSFDSLSKFIKTKYAGLDTVQTFTAAQTFSGGLTSSGATTFSGATQLNGTTTGSGTVTLSNTLNTVGGFQRAGSPAQALIASGQAQLASTYTTTATATALTGLTTGALSLIAGDTLVMYAQFDMKNTAAASVGVGDISDGTLVYGPLAVLNSLTLNARATVCAYTIYVAPSTATKTFNARARWSGAAGTDILLTQTSFTWLLYR